MAIDKATKSISATTKAMQLTYDAVVALVDVFCRVHLTDEDRDLARDMADADRRSWTLPSLTLTATSWPA